MAAEQTAQLGIEHEEQILLLLVSRKYPAVELQAVQVMADELYGRDRFPVYEQVMQ